MTTVIFPQFLSGIIFPKAPIKPHRQFKAHWNQPGREKVLNYLFEENHIFGHLVCSSLTWQLNHCCCSFSGVRLHFFRSQLMVDGKYSTRLLGSIRSYFVKFLVQCFRVENTIFMSNTISKKWTHLFASKQESCPMEYDYDFSFLSFLNFHALILTFWKTARIF